MYFVSFNVGQVTSVPCAPYSGGRLPIVLRPPPPLYAVALPLAQGALRQSVNRLSSFCPPSIGGVRQCPTRAWLAAIFLLRGPTRGVPRSLLDARNGCVML